MWSCRRETPRSADVPADRVDHRRRPAEVDVALGDVRDELPEMAGREQLAALGARVVADDVVHREPALVGDRAELVGEDDVAVRDDPVEDDDVAGHRLGERAHRGDADPAGDQQHLVAAPGGLGELAERPVERRRASRPGAILIRSVWSPTALALIRNDVPSGAAESENGWALHHWPRLRKRQMKNWPGARVEPVQPAPGDADGGDVRRLGDHLGDAKPVAKRPVDRDQEADRDQGDRPEEEQRASTWSPGDGRSA